MKVVYLTENRVKAVPCKGDCSMRFKTFMSELWARLQKTGHGLTCFAVHRRFIVVWKKTWSSFLALDCFEMVALMSQAVSALSGLRRFGG